MGFVDGEFGRDLWCMLQISSVPRKKWKVTGGPEYGMVPGESGGPKLRPRTRAAPPARVQRNTGSSSSSTETRQILHARTGERKNISRKGLNKNKIDHRDDSDTLLLRETKLKYVTQHRTQRNYRTEGIREGVSQQYKQNDDVLKSNMKQVPRWFSESRESVNKYRLASRVTAASHDKMVTAALLNYEDFEQKE